TDEAITLGGLIAVRGYGLKVEGDAEHAAQVGIFFASARCARSLPSGQNSRSSATRTAAIRHPEQPQLVAPNRRYSGRRTGAIRGAEQVQLGVKRHRQCPLAKWPNLQFGKPCNLFS
ncbi:MAG: hypothetical protein LBS63_05325, partial [Prevotellaceae bacterium]|nr:hypothetical protein [Prevotellaceae bacterium]